MTSSERRQMPPCKTVLVVSPFNLSFVHSRSFAFENPSLSRLCYRRIWGSRNRRALILGWAHYLDVFSSYPLRSWLPSVYRGHNNRYTRERPKYSPSLSLEFHYSSQTRAQRQMRRDPNLEFEGVENSDAHNAERRRQILLLTANDDEGFVVTSSHSRLMELEANSSRAA
uniref:Uncharacterized protein n=1 Tax=Salix viminalis TaxID=40686 RepID=A0A6N2MSY0_SALVM